MERKVGKVMCAQSASACVKHATSSLDRTSSHSHSFAITRRLIGSSCEDAGTSVDYTPHFA